MNVYVNLVPKKKFIKKIIILILFSILCFFIKENVFAESTSSIVSNVPDFFEDYSDYIISSMYTNEEKEMYILSDKDSHTFSSIIIDYALLTNPYVLVSRVPGQYQISETEMSTQIQFYFFPLKPYLKQNSSGNYDIYNINNENLMEPLTFYYLSCDSYYKTCGIFVYARTLDNYPNYYHTILDDSNFNDYDSNFDIVNTADEIIYNMTSSGTIEWNDEDFQTDNRNLLEKIIDSVVAIPLHIGQYLINLGNTIVDGIKSLFLPGDELEGFFEEEYAYLQEQLGFLIYPIEVVVDFANRIYELDNSTSAIFKIPKLEIFNHTLYEGTSFDLMSIVNANESFKNIYNLYKIAINGFIVLWLVQLAIKKEKEIFGGGTE